MSAAEKGAELDPVAVGAEIGAVLWRGRCFAEVDATHDALAWVRGSRAAQAAADTEDGAPGELLGALVPTDGSGQPIGGVLEAAARDLRMALSWLDGATITTRGRGYEPKEDDVFATLLAAERRVSVALRAVHLESLAAALAIHAAALGALPEAERAPRDYREDVPPTTLERVGRARGAGPGDVAAAAAVARAWGLGELGEARAERLLVGLARVRGDLEAEEPTTAPTGGGGPAAGGGGEPARRGAYWGAWRVRSTRGSVGAS